MGLEFRTASAKRLLLAMAAMLAVLLPAQAWAACTPVGTLFPIGPLTSNFLAGTDVFTTAGDTTYDIRGAVDGDGLYFDNGNVGDDIVIAARAPVDSTTKSSGFDAIMIEGDFGHICYDGTTAATLTGDFDGLSVYQYGPGDVDLAIAHTIVAPDGAVVVENDGGHFRVFATSKLTGGTTGVDVTQIGAGDVTIETAEVEGIAGDAIVISHLADGNITVTTNGDLTAGEIGVNIFRTPLGDGDVTVATKGDVTAADGAIFVLHWGDDGDVVIATADNATLTATGGIGFTYNVPLDPVSTAPIDFSGPAGIYADRSGVTGNIFINNRSDIVADSIGIYAHVCGCNDGDITIASSGDIDAGFLGIYGQTDLGTVRIDVTGGTIAAIGAGIMVQAPDAEITLGGGASIRAATGITGGTTLGPFLSSRVKGTVAGTIFSTGGTSILFGDEDDTVELHPTFSINEDVVAGAGTDDLILGGTTGTGDFDLDLIGTRYLGFDRFRKSGAATWRLLGTAAMPTIDLTVEGGAIEVVGNLAGLTLTVDASGRVTGIGTLARLINRGIIAPGNSIGTLTVAGNADFAAGSTYEVEVNAAGAADRIEAGSATIDTTARVVVIPIAGAYGKSTSYLILKTTGAISGDFINPPTVVSPFFDATLTKIANELLLTLTRNAVTISSQGLTPNQIATGAALDSFTAGPPYFAQFMALSSGQIPAALDAISGDGYASIVAALLKDQRFLRDAVLRRLAAARAELQLGGPLAYAAADDRAPATDSRDLWAHGFGGVGAIAGDGNGPGVDTSTGGFVIGGDSAFGDARLGAVLAYGMSHFSVPARQMTGDSRNLSFGAYGGTEWTDFYLSFGTTFTLHDVAARRTAAFAGVVDTYSASYPALTAQAFGEVGYEADFGAVSLTPFLGLALSQAITGAYAETGTGPGALSVAAAGNSLAIARLGLRLEHQFVLGDDKLVTLGGSAAWQHAFGGPATTANTFAGGAPFTVAGAPLAGSAIELAASADIDISERLALGLTYSGLLGGNGYAHGASASLYGTF